MLFLYQNQPALIDPASVSIVPSVAGRKTAVDSLTSFFFITLWRFMMKWLMYSTMFFTVVAPFVRAGDPGVILVQGSAHIIHGVCTNVTPHHYFGKVEGPMWENKYCGWRIYADNWNRYALDVQGKKAYIPTLSTFTDSNKDPHTNWSWGTDILKIEGWMGFGHFRLLHNGEWLKPMLGTTADSMVMDLLDTSLTTPRFKITYYGWVVNSSKLTVTWTVRTEWEKRATDCELRIDGNYSGDVVIGIQNRQGLPVIRDTGNHILATIGKQCGVGEGTADTLLAAVKCPSAYFKGFADDSGTNHTTINNGLVLKLDQQKTAKWSLVTSWQQEPSPLYRESNWMSLAFDGTSDVITSHVSPAAPIDIRILRRGDCLQIMAPSAMTGEHAAIALYRPDGRCLGIRQLHNGTAEWDSRELPRTCLIARVESQTGAHQFRFVQ
jgi:hypothetical protein